MQKGEIMGFPKLLSPNKIESLEPMGTNYANQDGSVSQRLIDYHVAKAKGGFGFVIIEATAVDPCGKTIANQLGLWSNEHIAGVKKIVDECHKYGSKVSVQLCHAGRETNALITDIHLVSSSATPSPKCLEIPSELTTEEVYGIIQKFVDAARRCWDASVDAVEVHAAYGYLIDQFLSSRMNKRVDEFGGNLENRMRFLLLIIQGIRQQVDNAYPIIVRISDEEGSSGGFSITEISTIVRHLEDAGVNAILVSTRPGYLAYLAEKIKKSVKIPVIIKFLLLPLADTLNLISQRISGRLARRIWSN
jgi:2,4-dienoyl-CoA reductase-like NADH-dependent reductase (Old Yellow Enzyme family)